MTEPVSDSTSTPKRTALHQRHLDLGARMVEFAGYDMPVQYAQGILQEHLWTRQNAGFFDVSHMGEAQIIASDGRHETAALALEALVPCDVLNLQPGQQRYSQLLDQAGGIIDDVMITRLAGAHNEGRLLLILNASRKHIDSEHIAERLPAGVRLEQATDRALVALQGPLAASILSQLAPGVTDLKFMHAAFFKILGIYCHVSRSGYTGEDGFEISLPSSEVTSIANALLDQNGVRPCGLGARDTLRLEAGLCLYGHELDLTTSPIEAGLAWSIQKRRRQSGNFPGADRIQSELEQGPPRLRVGILPAGRVPAREGTEILSSKGQPIGIVTSGGYAPSLSRPVAMGYVANDHSAIGTEVQLVVRGNAVPAHITALPFVPHRYFKA